MTRIDRRGFIRTTGVTAGAATLSISTAAAGHAAGRDVGRRVRTGFEVLHADDYRLVRGERVGLISNPTGTVPDLRHEIDLMVESGQVDLVAAFRPEHGFRGSEQVRLDIDAGADVDRVVAGWQDDLRAFRRVRDAHLRYGGRGR